jgi:hypothetical protein
MEDPRDFEALKLALEMLKQSEPELIPTLDEMVRDRGEQEVGAYAASVLQVKNLRLRPWECPPCETVDVSNPKNTYGYRPNEVALLKRMLEANISRWHPDPTAALAEAEAKSAA